MAVNVTGSFTATGQSGSFRPIVANRDTAVGSFNVALTGTAHATVQLERSLDNGATWCVITAAGTQLYRWTYNSATLANLSETCQEIEQGALYRLNCTAYTSGTLTYRLSPGQ